YPQRREMLEFGVKHFFDLNRRTDNCADCMVGDRSNSLVEALGEEQVRAGEYDRAIEIIERFRTERRNEVSDYAWAETATVVGEAYWKSGRQEKAVASMEREEPVTGDHPYVERFREQLERYREELKIAN
ncbi:MAG: hypothetical protein WBW88_07755, partial [Rhodothermales bacterium]